MIKAHVVVADGGRTPRTTHVCRLYGDLRMVYKQLANHCWKNPEQVDVDLFVLAGGIAFADRAVRRHRASGWARHISLRVPVTSTRWSDPKVQSSLREAIELLTGDIWDFDFYKRRQRDAAADQQFFETPHGREFVVVPYSGGLDSYAAFEHLRQTEPEVVPFLVTADHGARAVRAASGRYDHQVGVPMRVGAGGHAEPTYRSRTFLFFCMAAIAARLARARRIVIGEPGQGTLGVALLPFGDEPPYVGSHPLFTGKLRTFLKHLWREAPVFEHPFVWQTKREMISSVIAAGALGWEKTVSCSRDISRLKGTATPMHCGACSGCLYRRASLHGLRAEDEAHGPYYWGNLSVPELRDAVATPRTQKTTANDLDIARHAVGIQCALANFSPDAESLRRATFELAEVNGESASDLQARFRRMLAAHRTEWSDFLAAQKAEGWLRRMVGDLRLAAA